VNAPVKVQWSVHEDLNVLVYASLSRVLEQAPTDDKLGVFGLMAQAAADEVAAFQQQQIDDLWAVADDTGLVVTFDTTSVQSALDAVFNTEAVSGEYDGVFGTFADACREADRKFQQQAKRTPRPFNDHLPAATRQALDWLLQIDDADRLKHFIDGRSPSEAKKILAYLKARRS